MVANGVKSDSATALAKAGVSPADLIWLKMLKNSPARNTPRYQDMLSRVRSVARPGLNGNMVAA